MMNSTLPARTADDAARTDRADRADRADGLCMQGSLGTLLDRVPGSRTVVPHLAALERALGSMGAQAIESIPPASLARMHGQLVSLPMPAHDAPLQDLRTRMEAALAGAGLLPPLAPAAPQHKAPSVGTMPFVDSQLLSVCEASITEFDRAIADQDEVATSDPFAWAEPPPHQDR